MSSDIRDQPQPTQYDPSKPDLWPMVIRDIHEWWTKRWSGSGDIKELREVIKDMTDRDNIGRERYGTPLQPHNGRDALVDCYQELLDGAVYLRQAIEENQLDGGSIMVLGNLNASYHRLFDVIANVRWTINRK